MIKKILLALLLVAMIVLSLALYNQYTMLPERTVSELDDAERDKGLIDGTWAPPKAPEPTPPPAQQPEAKKLASWEEGQRDGQAPETQESAPEQEAQETAQQQKAEPETPPQQPPAQQEDESAKQKTVDEKLGHPELSAAMPGKPPPRQDKPQPEEPSKAEKALSKGKGWMLQEGEEAGNLLEKVEKELDHEQDVIRRMELSTKDEVSPEAKVNQLVKKLEDKGLGEQASRQQPPEPEPETAAEPEPRTAEPAPPKQARPQPAADRNILTSLDLLSDGEAVLLRITTRNPVKDYTDFQIHGPKRFVIDLHGRFSRSVPRVDVLPNAMVKDLRTGLHPDKLRIVADLHDDVAAAISVERPSPEALTVVLRPKH